MDTLFEAIKKSGSKCKVLKELLEEDTYRNLLKVIDEDSGFTPVTYATNIGNVAALKVALENGGDVNYKDANGDTPLYVAVARRQIKATECLLENGASIGAAHPNLLRYAVEYSCVPVVQALLKAGADPEYKESDAAVTPMQFVKNSLERSQALGFKSNRWIELVRAFE